MTSVHVFIEQTSYVSLDRFCACYQIMFGCNERISQIFSCSFRCASRLRFLKRFKDKETRVKQKRPVRFPVPLISDHKTCNEKYRKWMIRNGESPRHDPRQILLELLLDGTPSMLLTSARFYYSLFVRPAQVRNVIL